MVRCERRRLECDPRCGVIRSVGRRLLEATLEIRVSIRDGRSIRLEERVGSLPTPVECGRD
ncbi:hypothetical protein [Natronorubrum sp. FCH18a]|uniref:hypothetical protein n=1 Tax=Natronorubrum sp. FCH18a TaxID=3447018 RepID=UPI003F51703C